MRKKSRPLSNPTQNTPLSKHYVLYFGTSGGYRKDITILHWSLGALLAKRNVMGAGGEAKLYLHWRKRDGIDGSAAFSEAVKKRNMHCY